MSEVTRILASVEKDGQLATEKLLPLVYDELRALAARKLTREKPGQTLVATALVHEAYIRLVDGESEQSWNSRGHFFAAAAEAMRRILVEQARRKGSWKAGGRLDRVRLSHVEHDVVEEDGARGDRLDLLALDEALEKLEARDTRKAKLVKLRFFAGLTNKQAAEALGISTSTADADWAYAKSWLRIEMSGEGEPSRAAGREVAP